MVKRVLDNMKKDFSLVIERHWSPFTCYILFHELVVLAETSTCVSSSTMACCEVCHVNSHVRTIVGGMTWNQY